MAIREVIFRGKRLDDGKWLQGDLRQFKAGMYIESFRADGCKLNYVVDPKTVGQFTGLTDKNGTKIFEGDVVAYDVSEEGIQYANYAVIKWNENRIRYAVKWGGDCVDWLEKSDERYFCVAGNVFDNPELIGGADND